LPVKESEILRRRNPQSPCPPPLYARVWQFGLTPQVQSVAQPWRVAAAAVSDLFLVSAAFINNSATAIGRRKQLNGRHLQMRLLPGGTLLSFAGIVAATFHICLLI
jgi:hypothetical protein